MSAARSPRGSLAAPAAAGAALAAFHPRYGSLGNPPGTAPAAPAAGPPPPPGHLRPVAVAYAQYRRRTIVPGATAPTGGPLRTDAVITPPPDR
ncbi:hypothetical protein AB0G32_34450 [Streptomyces sp. NPDC023723]|uniref:hypothetical protein n=1 Tax=Streptomyces sp. NPDC023723 TaxID=3154323 RepID=UPI0033D13C50